MVRGSFCPRDREDRSKASGSSKGYHGLAKGDQTQNVNWEITIIL